jgi:2-methylisocitrate lyase-like PEP mutase family enzyme
VLVRPETVLRWHRDLITRRHARMSRPKQVGRPLTIRSIRRLVLTVDAEAGYGMDPAELVDALTEMGAAGCNLEDTDHTTGRLRDRAERADWLRAVCAAAAERDHRLVINARIDVFLSAPGSDGRGQVELVDDALRRLASVFR